MSGARIVLNSRYIHIAPLGEKADGKYAMTKDAVAGLIEYVGTREGVSMNLNALDLSDEVAARKATEKQIQTIDGLLKEVPSAKDSFEYED